MPPSRRSLLLVPLLLLAAAAVRTPPYPTVDLPVPGPCSPDPRPQLVVILADDSGSTLRTDPEERRYPETRQALSYVKEHTCHPQDTVVVGHFAERHTFTRPMLLSSFDPEDPSLAGPDESIGANATLLKDPARAAARLVTGYPDHDALLILLSDGWLDDEPGALRALKSFPGEIHVVALGEEPVWAASWSGRPPLSLQVLRGETDFGEVARGLASIWIAATRPPPSPGASPTPSPDASL